MDINQVVYIGRQLLVTSLLLVAPVVLVSLVVGLIISIGQTVTSIQEQTMTFAPKIVAVVAVLIAAMPWYLETLTTFTTDVFKFLTSVTQ